MDDLLSMDGLPQLSAHITSVDGLLSMDGLPQPSACSTSVDGLLSMDGLPLPSIDAHGDGPPTPPGPLAGGASPRQVGGLAAESSSALPSPAEPRADPEGPGIGGVESPSCSGTAP